MSEEDTKKFFVLITDDGYNSEISFAGLRYALTAIVQGHDVNVFLLGPGVLNALKDQNPTLGEPVGKWIKDILEAEGKVVACGICLKKRGFTQDNLIEGVVVGSMGDLVEVSAQSDVQITF